MTIRENIVPWPQEGGMFLIEQILNDSQDLRSSVVQVKEWAEVVRSNLLGVSQYNCDYAKSSVQKHSGSPHIRTEQTSSMHV